jgi:hypothetical protein
MPRSCQSADIAPIPQALTAQTQLIVLLGLRFVPSTWVKHSEFRALAGTFNPEILETGAEPVDSGDSVALYFGWILRTSDANTRNTMKDTAKVQPKAFLICLRVSAFTFLSPEMPNGLRFNAELSVNVKLKRDT